MAKVRKKKVKVNPEGVAHIKATFNNTVAPIIVVGHVPIEISRFIFFSLERRCSYTSDVVDKKPVRSPLQQGGLEIKCKVRATSCNQEFIQKNYDINTSLKDDSETILKSLKIEPDSSDSDTDMIELE